MNTLAARVRERREDLGMTQKELAVKSGLSQGAIGNIEAGIRKSSRSLLSLAVALKTTAQWLDSGEAAPSQSAWPFVLFTLDEYMSLAQSDKEAIEDFAYAKIGRAKQRKVA